MAQNAGNGKARNPGGKGTSAHAQYITVRLKCNHVLEFIMGHHIADGEILWCRHCKEYMEAVSIDTYLARCENCRYSRRFGLAKTTALTKATHHALTKMHKVTVTKGDETVEVISPKVTQESLPDAPF